MPSPTDTIASLRALLERATPGPWIDDGLILAPDAPEDMEPCVVDDASAEDRAVIVALHNAAPALLDVAEAAGRLADRMRWIEIDEAHTTTCQVVEADPDDADRLLYALARLDALAETST